MANVRISRRMMLRGTGGVAIGLPLLDIMTPSRAAARGLSHRKRLVVVQSPHGRQRSSNEHWQPVGIGQQFGLGTLHSSFEPLRDDMVVLSGVELTSARNQAGSCHAKGTTHSLTCTEHLETSDESAGAAGHAGGISVDQRAAQAIAKVETLPFASLQFGVQSGHHFTTDGSTTCSYISYAGAGDPVPAQDDPGAMFDKLFGGMRGDASQRVRLAAQRRSVLDLVMEDFESLQPALSANDRRRLDEHLTHIREIERSIGVTASKTSADCRAPSIDRHADAWRNNDSFPIVGRQQTDLLAMALACDLTRVATLQWSTGKSITRHTWIPGADTNGHHALTHDGPSSRAACNAITRWYADRVAGLVSQLAAIEEPDGTSLLANTVVLWVAGETGFADTHDFGNMPYVLFGQGGGALRTGQHLDLGPARPSNDLMLTLLHAMGIQDEVFGTPEYNTGVISQLLA